MHNNTAIVAVLLLVLGVKMLGDGISGFPHPFSMTQGHPSRVRYSPARLVKMGGNGRPMGLVRNDMEVP